jgi:cobalt-zinc-cadmium efflux system outer membrane protein
MRSQSLSSVVGRGVLGHGAGCVCALLVLVTGCGTFDQRTGFSDVSAAVEARSGKRVVWNLGTELDAQVAQEVRTLLEDTLTADEAIQVALLNNRQLQAMYAELGVAQADLVQAGLLTNPVFDGAVFFPIAGGPVKLDLSVAVSFLDVFYIPLRKRVAAARFEDAKLQVTGAVLDFAATVRAAFYRHQADEQRLELLQTIVQALAVSFDVTQRLHEAGNITDLDLARERAQVEEAKLQLRAAEVEVRQSRAQLNTVMGLWGPQTAWHIDRRLPDIPAPPLPFEGLEAQALRQSLDLASARQRLIAGGEQLGISRATALVPESSLGAGAEREEGEWGVGPVFEVPIPLFDQGQARIGRTVAELRRAQQEYYALGVRIRSTARAVRERLEGAQDRALYYRDILLPLRERIVNETLLQYNAMQLGVFELLRAREQQIQAAIAYVETLLDYWLARTELEQILSGRLPNPNGVATGRRERPTTMGENAGH